MPAHRHIPPQTVVSLLESCRTASDHQVEVQLLIEPGVADVAIARNLCVHRFMHQSTASHLFWIDSDMQWEPDCFMRMLAMASVTDAVCGAYPEKIEPLKFHVGTPGKVTMNEYGLVPCSSGGLGFAIVSRTAIANLTLRAPKVKLNKGDWAKAKIADVFHVTTGRVDNGEIIGEDVMFFRDLRAQGFEVWCDPCMKLGHVGDKVYEGKWVDAVAAEQPNNEAA